MGVSHPRHGTARHTMMAWPTPSTTENMSPFSFADAFDTVEATVCDPGTVRPTVLTKPPTLVSLDIPERALGRGAHGEGDGGALEATGHREPSPVTGRAQGGGKRGQKLNGHSQPPGAPPDALGGRVPERPGEAHGPEGDVVHNGRRHGGRCPLTGRRGRWGTLSWIHTQLSFGLSH